MKINLTNLAKNQIQLDNYIIKNNNLTKEETFNNRIMALLVEIGETANEIRFFKFWSQKKQAPDEVILEEFIDILHFVLSIGVAIDYDQWNLDFKSSVNIQDAFFNLYKAAIDFKGTNLKKEYKEILVTLFTVADCLSFDDQDIFKMYQKKNKINFTRQDTNY